MILEGIIEPQIYRCILTTKRAVLTTHTDALPPTSASIQLQPAFFLGAVNFLAMCQSLDLNLFMSKMRVSLCFRSPV